MPNRTRALDVSYAAASGIAISVYAFVPAFWQKIIFQAAGWAALSLVAIVLMRASPRDRAPWWLVTAGLIAGNIASRPGRPPDLPIGAGAQRVLDVAANVLFLAAAMTVVARRGRNDRGGLIEAAIFSAAAGGVVCAVVIMPNVASAYRTTMGELYVAGTMLVLYGVIGALVRLWQTARRHRRPLGLLMAAAALLLAGQTALVVFDRQATIFMEICFIGACTGLGLAGIDPRSADLARPGAPPDDHLTPWRLAWLGIAVAAMPASAVVPTLFHRPVSGVLIAACGTAIAVLVMMRIGLLSAQRRHAEKQLQHLAEHDPLTGTLNRRGFIARLRVAQESDTPSV
jgi:hypothetical protein